jgi:hypothetical protein
MKKTILVVLIVIMTASPCLAQEIEIEPEGLFRLEGTLWEADVEEGFAEFLRIGFYQGKVYWRDPFSCYYFRSSSYKNFIIFSMFEYFADQPDDYITGRGILFPLFGIGFMKHTWNNDRGESVRDLFLQKLTDNWIPASDCYEYMF